MLNLFRPEDITEQRAGIEKHRAANATKLLQMLQARPASLAME